MVNKSLFMIALVFSSSVFADENYLQEHLTFERLCLEGKDFHDSRDRTKVIIPALRSCYLAGVGRFYGGRGVPKDPAKGVRFLQMACDNLTVSNVDQYSIKSCTLLGQIYYCGDKETPGMWGAEMGDIASKYNKEQALKYFAKACDLGDSESCNLKMAVMNNASCYRN